MDLLRRVAGLYPAEAVPAEALKVADEVLEKYGTDGLRLLVLGLTSRAAVAIESEAHASGRPLESLLDEMELIRLEAINGDDED
ncbi:hypothetical protein [Streptomyces sp. NPDC048277]|uniref:hypothetical protein n=1 Tax=Streptomyces sp. NPDC048277 TaxID=3155027 RepID=UPI0033C83C6D